MSEDNGSTYKRKIQDLQNIFELEDLLILLNRASHFIEHDKITRQDIFRKSIIINYHSYFLDNKRAVNSLIERLKKKVALLDEIEYKIDEPATLAYEKRIWDDICTILDNLEEQISYSVERLEKGLKTDFVIDIEDYQKTKIIRQIEKLERPNNENLNNNWPLDDDFSHGLT